MKTIKIFWTPFALSRIDEIFDYIADQARSAAPANKLVSRIMKRTDQLIRFPESGQKEMLLQEIGQNSRYLLIGNYKIIYEYHKNENIIIITDVFHTRQNPKKLTLTDL
ncbi:MAG: type II toxin-antitoxin system RelE/ParE family toxin [Bacteroidetes bacterium CG_4_10_14_3_um_filter_31_20]|nr:MAG: type II toxin-antitoxin system RelE/ParE family toxin [Bacteroidetes bacterium CG_4_10_14_3_um_filter_31_20]